MTLRNIGSDNVRPDCIKSGLNLNMSLDLWQRAPYWSLLAQTEISIKRARGIPLLFAPPKIICYTSLLLSNYMFITNWVPASS